MKKAMIADLKNRLSYFLRFVRAGQSVLVYDRDRPIARIDPVRDPADAAGDWTVDLEQRGVLRPPAARLSPEWFANRPRTRADVVAALVDERASGR